MNRRERKARKRYYEQFDIVKRNFTLPDSVCILAPGINAMTENAYDKITAPVIIAVNKAVALRIKGKQPGIWLVSDGNCVMSDWFNPINDIYAGIRCFSSNVCVRALKYPLEYEIDKFYTFRLCHRTMEGYRKFTETDVIPEYTPVAGIFRPDISSAGTAIRLAHCKGVKRVELCGVDMSEMYYDNTERKSENPNTNGIDSFRDRLDSAIEYFKKDGMEIISLSTTNLNNVEVIQK